MTQGLPQGYDSDIMISIVGEGFLNSKFLTCRIVGAEWEVSGAVEWESATEAKCHMNRTAFMAVPYSSWCSHFFGILGPCCFELASF